MSSLLLNAPVFVSYGSEHLIWLLAGICSTLFWIRLGRRQQDALGQQRIGFVMSLLPALLWVCLSIYMLACVRPVDLGLVLPFHVCYFLNLMMPLLMWRRSYFLFELFYFMVMAGCIQALITPDVQTTFPHFMNIRYFVIHMCLAQSILYAIFVFGFKPTWRSLGKSYLWTNIYFVFIVGVNGLLDTNFMYLRRKPTAATLLDIFGDWPWYIAGGEVLALVLFAVVMLPFAVPASMGRKGWQEEKIAQ